MQNINVSSCCKVEINNKKCSKCNKNCSIVSVCALCLGKGVIAVDEEDGEGHLMRGVGEEKCPNC